MELFNRCVRANSLKNGVQVREEAERVRFLDGRYRILFSTVDGEARTRAGLPGLERQPGTVVDRKPAQTRLH